MDPFEGADVVWGGLSLPCHERIMVPAPADRPPRLKQLISRVCVFGPQAFELRAQGGQLQAEGERSVYTRAFEHALAHRNSGAQQPSTPIGEYSIINKIADFFGGQLHHRTPLIVSTAEVGPQEIGQDVGAHARLAPELP